MTLGEELSAKIKKLYQGGGKSSRDLNAILAKIEKGGGTYIDAHDYAYLAGKMLSDIFGCTITVDVLPNGQLDVVDAGKIISDALKMNFDDVSGTTARIQRNLNRAAGLDLDPVLPRINTARVNGMTTLASSGPVDQIMDELMEALTTFSQHIVDDELKANADAHYKAGFTPKIIRKAESGCCKWCSALAGEYEYPNVNRDVFRRHQRCRCVTDYNPGDGINHWQNVWNQSQWREFD